MGELDEQLWSVHYASLFDTPDKFSQVSLVTPALLKGEDWMLFSELMSLTSILAIDPVMFKLNLLLSLTEPLRDDPGPNDLTSLHFKYKMILKRRLKWKPDWFRLQTGFKEPDLQVDRLFSTRNSLARLAALTEKIMAPSN